MRGAWINKAVKAATPVEALHWPLLRWLLLLRSSTRLIGPGGQNPVARYLDQLAARRVLQAIAVKTDDVQTVRWLGLPIWQYPLDAWVIQEMVGELKPDIIVETGTWTGGSAYFFACLCDLIGKGEVISIDIATRGTIAHPRITYLTGSSTNPDMVRIVAERIGQARASKVLIALDSDHSAEHVGQELVAYAPLIPVGSYMHVQDGCIDELRYFRAGRPGPVVAVKSFLRDHPQFIRDYEIESRYVMTAHPYGWLRRVKPD